MCEYFGYRVERLVRVRIMNIELGDLPVGQYREVTPQEYRSLLKLLEGSGNAPVIPAADNKKKDRNQKYGRSKRAN
jgi:23S rRNA pseudouridine2604 synthase